MVKLLNDKLFEAGWSGPRDTAGTNLFTFVYSMEYDLRTLRISVDASLKSTVMKFAFRCSGHEGATTVDLCDPDSCDKLIDCVGELLKRAPR